MNEVHVPLIIRGKIIEDYEVRYEDRSRTGNGFLTPSVEKYASQLVNNDPRSLIDLYSISLGEIYQFIENLGARLNFSNVHWRQAFEVSCRASNLSRSVLESFYQTAGDRLRRETVSSIVETRIGERFLEGWVPTRIFDGREIQVRAMGSRAVHIIAGNIPSVAIMTLLRSAVTRGDAIIKLPSNDPLTAVAIARTMIEMAPDHPLTRHFSVAYWKGGDEAVESKIYHPTNIEKIVAWGGFASIKHISKYLQPGIDLITLDPKNSSTIIGREVFANESEMAEVARRTAVDLGGLDQEACANARIIYLESGTDPAGIERANRFGEKVFEAMQALPRTISGGPVRFDPILLGEIKSILGMDDFYRIYTDPQQIEKTGAVIVSQHSEQVDFPKLLYGRVGNIVPIDDPQEALDRFTSATQTVGIYPDALRTRLRDQAALAGGQMFVPIGYALRSTMAAPQDGIEPERRMCRWVVDNICDPVVTPGPWLNPGELYVDRRQDRDEPWRSAKGEE